MAEACLQLKSVTPIKYFNVTRKRESTFRFKLKSTMLFYGSARRAAIEESSAKSFGDFPDLFVTCIGAPRSNSNETSEPNPLLAAMCRGVLLSLSPRPTSDPFLRLYVCMFFGENIREVTTREEHRKRAVGQVIVMPYYSGNRGNLQ